MTPFIAMVSCLAGCAEKIGELLDAGGSVVAKQVGVRRDSMQSGGACGAVKRVMSSDGRREECLW